MQKALVGELNRCFAERLRERLPGFEVCDRDGDVTFWAKRVAGDLVFVVMLQPFEDWRDAFTIDIAWSDEAAFPYAAPRPYRTDGAKGRERLAMLWWKRGMREYTWAMVATDPDDVFWANLEARRRRGERLDRRVNPRPAAVEDLLLRVKPLVEDAVEKLVEYGVPLWREVAERHGVEWGM